MHCLLYKNAIYSSFVLGNVGKELEENLGQIKEVLGHIWIHSSHALLSLNFFKSLEKIHGENLYNG